MSKKEEKMNHRVRRGKCNILLGLIINTAATPILDSTMELMPDMVSIQAAYINQQRLDGTSRIAAHAAQ